MPAGPEGPRHVRVVLDFAGISPDQLQPVTQLFATGQLNAS